MAVSEIPCIIMRGGTSKALFLREEHLPPVGEARDRLILALFGSPDRRQIDGLGGADPLTSKLAIIGPPRVPETDLTYTFAQVGIDRPHVDYHSLCGNISSAVGHFAVAEGLVPASEPVTLVRVYTTNLDRTLRVEVPVRAGRPVDLGSYAIPGVPGTGARILLDLADTAGGATGQLLPTGSPTTVLDVAGVGEIEVTLIDIGNAHVFVRAADVGLTGIESAADIDGDPGLLDRLERIRAAAAVRMGMLADAGRARDETPATPILGMVAPARDYRVALTGATVQANEIDLVARLLFMQIAHKTYAGTSTACTGVAARIPGTVVHEAVAAGGREWAELRIGHPAGVITTEARVAPDGRGWRVQRATLGRTARRLMQGTAYLPEDAP